MYVGLIKNEASINMYLTENSRSINWKEGRRLIEMGILAEQLYRGCSSCHQPLHLINCIDEQHFGLGSLFSITCSNCKNVTQVSSGKRHSSTYSTGDQKNRKTCTWDVNTKLASGIIYMIIYD